MPINDLAWFRKNTVEVEKPLGENSLWIPLLEGDGPITRMVFWAVERAVCPEPFISLSLAPGQIQKWSSWYRFSGDDTLDSSSKKASD